MDDDDPFAVVAPTEKKMSSYLKKQSSRGPSSSKCVETSSHGTNSTRSTTNSTLPPEDNNFFSSKSTDFSSKKSSSSGFNNSASSGSANFEFGNGLEFGQGFGSSGFEDDGFGVTTQDKKAELPSLFAAAQDPFEAPSAPKSMRNFAPASSGFDSFNDIPSAPQSMRDFGATSSGFDDSFETPPRVPQSMRNFGSTSNSFDEFGSSDPFKNVDKGFASFEQEEDPHFQDDGFGTDPFATPGEASAWEKRENWKNTGARSRSGDVPKKSSGEKRRGGTPRRFHSTDDIKLIDPGNGPSPKVSSRKPVSSRRLNSSERSSNSQKGSDKSPRQRERKSSDRSPVRGEVRRTRSGVRPSRRSTMDTSGHTQESEATNQSSEKQQPRKRPPRRGSLGFTTSDGSLEPTTKIPPSRNKSSSGPAHRPGGGRRHKRTELSQNSASKLDFMQMNLPANDKKDDSSAEGDDSGRKDAKWDKERSKNQEKIMDMYRGGGELSSKSDSKINDLSLGDLDKQIGLMSLPDEEGDASSDRGSRKGRGLLRRNKKTDEEKGDEGYKEPMGRKDRTKGSLLDRVVTDTSSKSGHDSVQSGGGQSYSDRIMKAQQERNKRN